jgi:hypothetical protein
LQGVAVLDADDWVESCAGVDEWGDHSGARSTCTCYNAGDTTILVDNERGRI